MRDTVRDMGLQVESQKSPTRWLAETSKPNTTQHNTTTPRAACIPRIHWFAPHHTLPSQSAGRTRAFECVSCRSSPQAAVACVSQTRNSRRSNRIRVRCVAYSTNFRRPVVLSQPNEPRHNLQRPHWLALQHLKRHNAKALGRVHGAPVCKLLVVQAACHNTARNQRVEQSDSTTNSVEPHRSHISALLALTSLCSHSSIARIEASTACSNGSGTFEMT